MEHMCLLMFINYIANLNILEICDVTDVIYYAKPLLC